jgi:hypothetical protein
MLSRVAVLLLAFSILLELVEYRDWFTQSLDDGKEEHDDTLSALQVALSSTVVGKSNQTMHGQARDDGHGEEYKEALDQAIAMMMSAMDSVDELERKLEDVERHTQELGRKTEALDSATLDGEAVESTNQAVEKAKAVLLEVSSTMTQSKKVVAEKQKIAKASHNDPALVGIHTRLSAAQAKIGKLRSAVGRVDKLMRARKGKDPEDPDDKFSGEDELEKSADEKVGGHEKGDKGDGHGEEEQEGLDEAFYEATSGIKSQFIILNPHLAISICLFFSICVAMGLVYLVNWNSKEMRYYAWLLVSNTIAIFVAVLLFQAITTFVVEKLMKKASYATLTGWSFGIFILLFSIMLFTTAQASGSFHWLPATFWKNPFYPPEEWRRWVDRVHKKMEISDQKSLLTRRAKSWGMLMAHAIGFSGINLGGYIQHGMISAGWGSLCTYVVPVMMFLFLNLFFWFARSIRLSLLRMSRDPVTRAERLIKRREESNASINVDELAENKLWSFELWDDVALDAEEDAAATAVSFLLVQSLRLNITGRLPNNFGVEENFYLHPPSVAIKLLLFSWIFLIGLVITVMVKWDATDAEGRIAGLGRLGKRFITVTQNACAQAAAWCTYFAFQTGEAQLLQNEAPWTITERIILAFFCSVYAFFWIFLLDTIEQYEWSGSGRMSRIAKDNTISFITALSFLVGFAWEQSFDRAVEVIALVTEHTTLVEICLSFAIFCVVIVPWRRHILQHVIEYEESQHEEEESNVVKK